MFDMSLVTWITGYDNILDTLNIRLIKKTDLECKVNYFKLETMNKGKIGTIIINYLVGSTTSSRSSCYTNQIELCLDSLHMLPQLFL